MRNSVKNKIENDIFELCREKLNDRFNSFSQLKESQLNEFEDGPRVNSLLENIDYRSEILLYGPDITIRFQIFYNWNFFSTYLKNIYDQVTKERVIDFFNEVGNLTGGKVKEIFFEQGIVATLSLPMSINTNKSKINQSKEVLGQYKMFESMFQGQSIYLGKISFEIHNQGKFSSFDKQLSKLEIQDGEVDFF